MLAAGLGLSGAAAAPATSASGLSAVRDLIATTQGDRATVSWRAPASGEVTSYQVEAHRNDYYNETAPDFGTRIVPAPATSVVWPDLPLGQPVYFTVMPFGAGGSSGGVGPYNATGKITATNSYCRVSNTQYCVVVNTNDRLGGEHRPGAGLLHGTVPSDNKWVRALHLTHWRIDAANAYQYREVTAVVPARNVIEILSDAWYGATRGRTSFAGDPWSDWASYTTFISTTVHQAMLKGENPIWEIENEPEYYPYSPAAPPTRARIEEQYLRAYRAIKRVDPHARVIAPSISWNPSSAHIPWSFDMATWVTFAAKHAMRLYALSWHNNSAQKDQNPLVFAEMPQALSDQAQQVRELIATHPRIGRPKLFVDENSSRSGHFIPGFTVGYLAAQDQAGVDEANRSCWPYPGLSVGYSCFGPNLGGLLNADGNPNPNYWVMVDYGAMSGERVRSEVSSVNVSALAVTDRSQTTRILLGRHQTCSQPTTGPAYCAGPAKPPAGLPAIVKVLMRDGAQSAKVRIEQVPNSRSDVTKAPRVTSTTVSVRRGVATVRLPSFAEGAACFLTITPGSSEGAAAASGQRSRAEIPPAVGGSTPTRVLPSAGLNQETSILHGFVSPLVALATDQYGNPLAGQRVTFVVAKGFAHFPNSADTATSLTNRYGVATSPAVVAGLKVGRWAAAAYLTSLGSSAGQPVAYFGLRNRLS